MLKRITIASLLVVATVLVSAQSPGFLRALRLNLIIGTTTTVSIIPYTGDPEGNIIGRPGDLVVSSNGVLYQKDAGTGTDMTGWVAKGTASSGVTAASNFGTDNCLIRSDGTGKGVQVSQWCVDDGGAGTGVEIDAEGSGNILTIPAVYIFPWAVCQAGTGSLVIGYKTLAPTAGCIAGTNVDWPIATFPDADGEYGGLFHLPVPGDWTGTVDVAGKWRTAAISGDVVVQFVWTCTADAEVAADSWSSASTTTDTAKGTTLQWNAWSIAGVTLTGCAADEEYVGRIFRQRTHGSDSLSGTFDMVAPVRFTFRRAM